MKFSSGFMKTVRLVSQLPEDLAFVSDDIGVKTVKKHLGIEKYDCFLSELRTGVTTKSGAWTE